MHLLLQAALTFKQHIIAGVLTTLIPVAILALIGLLKKPVRSFLRYQRTEYDFVFAENQGPTTWDIQWEGYRLTIRVQDVHNNYIEGVNVIEHKTPPGKDFPQLNASDQFESLFKGALEFKLNTIIRISPTNGTRKYILRFVLRRRRG